MSNPLRMAIVSREYPPFFGGGIGTYVRAIVPALAAQGVQVHVITQAYDKTHPRTTVDGHVVVHRVPLSEGFGGWPNAAARFSIQAARVIASLYRSNRIDIAEFAECEAAGLATLLNARRRPPTVVQLHTPSEQLFALRSHSVRNLDHRYRQYFEMERLGMHMADEILAPSNFIANWAKQHYQFSRTPSVIPYATGKLPPSPERAGVSKFRSVFYAGRIEPRKGVESLILAFNTVARSAPNAMLRLAGGDTSGAPGGGSMRSYLETLIEPDVRERVKFLGRLDRKAMDSEYARAHFCVIPSLWENFPNTCIESMSNARAVLVSDQGGMKEMFNNQRAGRIFSAGITEDLARVMVEMLHESDESLFERGSIARKEIEHICDPQRIAKLRVEHALTVIENAQQNQPGTARGAMSAWKGMEDGLEGRLDSYRIPQISTQVARWVERNEGAKCATS